MKKTGFNGYVYDFTLDYDATDIDDIKEIHKYLMKKNKIMWMKIFRFVNSIKFHKCNSIECNSTECNSVKLYFNEESRM